jgi:putative FmdB family regulatory protein
MPGSQQRPRRDVEVSVPTYAYACSACEHAFDVRQSFSDDALTTCPECEQESLRKVFSPVGVVFKGSGFYRNDSRASHKGKTAGSGKPAGTPATPATDTTDASSSTSAKADTSGSGSSGGSPGKGSGSPGSSGGGSGSATPAA